MQQAPGYGILLMILLWAPAAATAAETSSPSPPAPRPASSPARDRDEADAGDGDEDPGFALALRSEDGTAELRLLGYVQLWATVHEEVEHGLRQAYSHDSSVKEASGFSFRRVRLGARARLFEGALEGRFEVRLEGGGPGMMDAYAAWNPLDDAAVLCLGQMKIPSTYEVAVPSTELDFANRSLLSEHMPDWALSEGALMSSPFAGLRTYMRDLGLGLRGELYGFRYFLMVGNGLGANLFIGGRERKQQLFTNAFGAYFYGASASFSLFDLLRAPADAFPVREVEVGGHCSLNRHHDAVLNDERNTIDLVRRSWSAHVKVDVLGRLRVTAMMGGGEILDDFDFDGKTDYRYAGWEIKIMAVLLPRWLEAGFRVDAYEEERFSSGDTETDYHYTLGLTFSVEPHVRVQVQYQYKVLESRTEPDLDDDLFLVSAQLRF